MAEAITVADVRAECPNGLTDGFITGLIACVDAADACLDANVTDPALQKAIKTSGVCYMIEQQQRGNVKSEKSPSGASRSYRDSGSSLDTNWGRMLQTIDKTGCVLGVIKAAGPGPLLRAI
jgi:hypothetical protein